MTQRLVATSLLSCVICLHSHPALRATCEILPDAKGPNARVFIGQSRVSLGMYAFNAFWDLLHMSCEGGIAYWWQPIIAGGRWRKDVGAGMLPVIVKSQRIPIAGAMELPRFVRQQS